MIFPTLEDFSAYSQMENDIGSGALLHLLPGIIYLGTLDTI